jgi:MATE family multidrug resistance protein
MASLALPGVIMIEAEFFAFEILTLSASRFGTETLAAQSILSTCGTLIFQVPFGLSIAASTRIATFIGSQSIINAQKAINISLCMALGLGSLTTTLIYAGKGFIVTWFTDDVSVIAKAVVALKILAVNQLYDTINVIAAGCLRGQGRQKIGSNLNIICYYVIALPLALYLAFRRDFRLEGLWTGLGVGIFVLAVSETYAVMKVDWATVLRESNERNTMD